MLDLLRLLIAIPFFTYASYQDWKERLVSPQIWLVLGVFAIALSIYQFPSKEGLLPIAASSIFFFEWFFEWEGREKVFQAFLWLLALSMIILALYIHSPPVLIVSAILLPIFRAFHRAGVLKGRADARAIMTVALLQPNYPSFLDFPIFKTEFVDIVELTFPFAFLVLLYAAVMAMLLLLAFFFLNLMRGDTGFPEMFLGYRVDIDKVNPEKSWLMERVIDGEHVLVIRPGEHSDEDIENLRKIGRRRVWVQPKIPFIVFITIGLLMAYILGNPI